MDTIAKCSPVVTPMNHINSFQFQRPDIFFPVSLHLQPLPHHIVRMRGLAWLLFLYNALPSVL